MPLEICSVGGYNQVGKNMTAINIDSNVIICDMGIHLENYIKLTEDEDILNILPRELIEVDAVPNIDTIKKWQDKVIAIVPTHAHLDHVGAIPFIAQYYDAPIICTPFTNYVLKAICDSASLKLKNDIKVLNANSTIKINGEISIEFISMTHSVPQTAMVVIHTKYGKIVYANDFKLDNYPVLGTKVNYKRIRELGKDNVLCLIVDSTYSREHKKMPSESVAREMLKDVLLGTNSDGRAVIITTFSSHIARLKSIADFGQKMGRKVIFMGRSLEKYISAAEQVGFINFSDKFEIVKYSSKIKPRLNKIIKEGREKYLVVVTGHQGEPKATLSKMANGMFDFQRGDHVVFSSTVIPTETNQKNRANIEEDLTRQGVRVFTDIHVSGHAGREDLRDMIEMIQPKHIIPAHGEPSMTSASKDLALELGYNAENVHVMQDGEFCKIE